MALMPPLFINPSFWMSAVDGGAAGVVAMATAAGKKQQKKAPGSPKISNNFKPVSRQNLPCVAKAGSGVSKPEAVGSRPRKWPQEGTYRSSRAGRAAARAGKGGAGDRAAESPAPAAVLSQYDMSDDDTDDEGANNYGTNNETADDEGFGDGLTKEEAVEWGTGAHIDGAAYAVPMEGGAYDNGIKDEAAKDDDQRSWKGRSIKGARQGRARRQDCMHQQGQLGQRRERERRRQKPAWPQALAAAAKLYGAVSGTPRKKARGGEAQFPFRFNRKRAYTAQSAKAKPPAIAAKHNDPDDRTAQRPYGGHGKAGAPKAPAKGVHGVKIIASTRTTRTTTTRAWVPRNRHCSELRALAAAAVRGKVGVRRGDGGAGMCQDDSITAAARFALGVEERMPDDEARATLESLLGAKVMRRALAALCDDTNDEEEQDNDNKEEQSDDGKEDKFVITQDDNTEVNETSGGEAPKVQQASGWKAHQQTHKEAHHLAYRGGGMLGLSSER
jgi:hypothetical protein